MSHTCAHVAPVPCASSIAIRAGSSSVAYALVTESENWLSTSYGVGAPRPHLIVARFESGLHAREQQRHDGGRQHRQRHAGGVGAPDQRPATEHDDHVDPDHEPRQAEPDDQPAPTPAVQARGSATRSHGSVCASSASRGRGFAAPPCGDSRSKPR